MLSSSKNKIYFTNPGRRWHHLQEMAPSVKVAYRCHIPLSQDCLCHITQSQTKDFLKNRFKSQVGISQHVFNVFIACKSYLSFKILKMTCIAFPFYIYLPNNAMKAESMTCLRVSSESFNVELGFDLGYSQFWSNTVVLANIFLIDLLVIPCLSKGFNTIYPCN